ncbi:hypothetical protein [Curvivirga sp.]|uniref:hypothetical protein n=1 Tax=Curvivirga sp. TaxID=2856848 RepID=UPI003B5BEDCA
MTVVDEISDNCISGLNSNSSMPLLVNDKVSSLIRNYFQRAQQFQISEEIINSYCNQENVPREMALLQMEEVKRFVCVRAAIDGPARNGIFKIGMSGPVDLFWHTFLLYSPAYFDFCEHVCGFYIQHSPNPASMGKEEEVTRLHNLFDCYEAAFGHEPPKHIWCIDREEINARLKS